MSPLLIFSFNRMLIFVSCLLVLLSGGSASPSSEISPYMDEDFIIIKPMSPILTAYEKED